MRDHSRPISFDFNSPWGRGSLRIWTLWVVMLCAMLLPQKSQAQYRQMDIAADVKSRFSSGCSSVQELMTQAEFKKLDGLLFSDYARRSIQYGLPYLERVAKTKFEGPSVLDSGPAAYLSEISQNDRVDDTVVLMPGVEVAPIYYWTGDSVGQERVAHNWDKHLWIVGLPDTVAYEQLPILNSGFTTRHWRQNIVAFSIFSVAALIGLLFCVSRRWRFRGTSLIFTVAMTLLAANHHPFNSSPFDPYQGDPGVQPYQDLIDYADSKGAMVFWSHLETPVAKRMKNSLVSFTAKTDAHPNDLLLTRHYTGFQAVNESHVTAVDPGREWDQVLQEYLDGQREKPVWGYGSNNFHCEGKASLGGVRTVVLAKSKDRAAVMEALRAGRMYGVKQGERQKRLSLDKFELTEPATGNRAIMGEGLNTAQAPQINIQLSMTDGSAARVKIILIRNGKIVRKAVLPLPVEDVWEDASVDRVQPAYYRLLVEADDFNRLVSNPIFLNIGAPLEKTQVAAKVVPEPEVTTPEEAAPAPQPVLPEKQPAPPADTTPSPAPEKQAASTAPEAPASEKSTVPPVESTSPPAPEKQAVSTVPEKSTVPPEPENPIAEGSVEKRTVKVMANSVRLRKGPGITFPVAGQAAKGDQLLYVRTTDVVFKGRAWMVIEKGGHKAYIWSGLVQGP